MIKPNLTEAEELTRLAQFYLESPDQTESDYEALDYFHQALASAKDILPFDSLALIDYLTNVGGCYCSRQKHKLGLPYLEEALRIEEIQMAKGNLETSRVLRYLAEKYAEAGQTEDAIDLYLQKAERETDTLKLGNLFILIADCYHTLKDYANEEVYLIKVVLLSYERWTGADHIYQGISKANYLKDLNLLLDFYEAQGRLDLAENPAQQIVNLSPTHPNLTRLANILERQGKTDEAKQMWLEFTPF
jgi:tetratricopeptide (TPR) repeat protein